MRLGPKKTEIGKEIKGKKKEIKKKRKRDRNKHVLRYEEMRFSETYKK